MTHYVLSKDAQNDLREVARYTRNKWGDEQLVKYRDGLISAFGSMGNNEIFARAFSNKFPQLRVVKYRYHFIFFIAEHVEKSIIIGVIHEKRNIVKHLAERLT